MRSRFLNRLSAAVSTSSPGPCPAWPLPSPTITQQDQALSSLVVQSRYYVSSLLPLTHACHAVTNPAHSLRQYHTSIHSADAAPQTAGPQETSYASSGTGSSRQSDSSSAGHGAEDIKNRLLDAALALVPQHGWSASALQAAARQLGMSPAVIGILPRPEAQLVEAFIRRCNTALVSELSALQASGQLSTLKTRDRLALAVRLRLSMIAPHIATWSQALSIVSTPSNLPHALGLLHTLVDDMWAAAGDTATDTSWYTKRATLAGVYTATELYMLTDYSPDFEDTWQALERRLDDVAALGGAVRHVQQAAQAAWQQATQAAAAAAKAAASGTPAAAQAGAAGSPAAAKGPAGSATSSPAESSDGLPDNAHATARS